MAADVFFKIDLKTTFLPKIECGGLKVGFDLCSWEYENKIQCIL